MARRIDFHDDPEAPVASVIVPSVNVAVCNDLGELLLIRRTVIPESYVTRRPKAPCSVPAPRRDLGDTPRVPTGRLLAVAHPDPR